MAANVEKLKKRYPDGFSTEDSQARRDKIKSKDGKDFYIFEADEKHETAKRECQL